jgi:hypothetical protein
MPTESRRRLLPALHLVDLLLDRWAAWSAGDLEKLGYGLSMSQKLIEWHERGVEPDHYVSMRKDEHCPDGVLMIDRLVARLEPELHNAICEEYFTYAPIEMKARRAHQSVAQFRRNLDRARWCLRQIMLVLELEFDADGMLRETA